MTLTAGTPLFAIKILFIFLSIVVPHTYQIKRPLPDE